MRSASSGLTSILQGSHQITTRVDVLYNRQVVESDLPMVSGIITWDRDAARLASLTMRIADPVRVPVSSVDVLTPFGYEIQVLRGAYLATGDPELVSLGVFPIQKSSIEGVYLNTDIQARDRSQQVSDARLEDTYVVSAGTNYATAISALILDGVPDLTVQFPTTAYTTPQLIFDAQDDRWTRAQEMARSIGMEVYFDGVGVCKLRAEPSFTGDPVYTIETGVNLVAAKVELDREQSYNKVIAVSRNASLGTQYRGEAADNDPTSPTYYGGPFGHKPRFFYSEFLNSDAQATAAAQGLLASNLGVARGVDLESLPNPLLETGDLIYAEYTDIGVQDLHIVDRMQLGLTPDSSTQLGVRAKQAFVP